MATELKILNLAFRPLSDQDDEENADIDTGNETLDDEEEEDEGGGKVEEDEPDVEQ
jgi:hypothetical protein